MPRPKKLTLEIPALDTDGIAQSQARGSAGNLTLNGALASGGSVTFSTSQRVGITSAGDDTGITFTVTGTDRYGDVLTETVTGSDTDVAITEGNFATVTQIASSGAAAGNVSAGTTGRSDTPWYPANYNQSPYEAAISVEIESGAAIYTVQHTLENLQVTKYPETTAIFNHIDMVDATDSDVGNYYKPITGMRLRAQNTAEEGGASLTIAFRISEQKFMR